MAVAPKDRKRADALIERALMVPVDNPRGFDTWINFGGATGSAARVLACARRAGYTDMAGAVARVLASRSTGSIHGKAMEIRSQLVAAAMLALTDPSAARQVLRDIEDRSGLGGHELARVAGRRWLTAWALADPKHAADLFAAEMLAVQGERDLNLQTTGLLKMTEALIAPPHRREELVLGEFGASWFPGRSE